MLDRTLPAGTIFQAPAPSERMSDERLDQLRDAAANWRDAPSTTIYAHVAGLISVELVNEIDRLRSELSTRPLPAVGDEAALVSKLRNALGSPLARQWMNEAADLIETLSASLRAAEGERDEARERADRRIVTSAELIAMGKRAAGAVSLGGRHSSSADKGDSQKLLDAAALVAKEAARIDGDAQFLKVPREAIGLLRITLAIINDKDDADGK